MTREEVAGVLKGILMQQERVPVDVNTISLDTPIDRIGFDSLSLIDFVYDVESRFNVLIEIADLVGLERVGDLVDYVQRKLPE